jgi:hypothetical protein
MYTNILYTCTQSYLTGLGCEMALVDLGLDPIVEAGEEEEGEEAGGGQGVEHLRVDAQLE